MTIPSYWKQASRELAQQDRVLRRLIKIHSGMAMRSRGDAFMTLARSIVGQQISLKAADSVWKKLLSAVPAISAQHIAGADSAELRNCGLSSNKVLYLQDLAQSFVNGSLDVAEWKHLDDDELIAELREAGARVNLIRDGDVAPAIAAAQTGTGVDLLMGIGGTPEGVISAAAIKCLGGAMQGKLWPRNDDERRSLIDAGFDLDRVLTADDLVQGDDVFVAATGVTSGALLRGVRVVGDRVETESIVMRSRSGTFRRIVASHPLTKIQSLMKGAR